MANFNGLDMGVVFFMNTAPNPTARQVNAYAGANGLEILNQGSRGGTTVAAGALVSPTVAGVVAWEQAFRSLVVNGGGYTLIDTTGTAWSPVILARFAPVGRVEQVAGQGWGRKYEVEFLHVT